jgi:hypothetical protein
MNPYECQQITVPWGIFKLDSRVIYKDGRRARTGTIVSLNAISGRARIKWDGERNLRTWIRIEALELDPSQKSSI